MLEIRTFRSDRKGIRVDLFRKYKHVDSKTGKSKISYKQVGSFSLSEGCTSNVIELLQPDEIMQLKNWLSENRFAEQFNVESDMLPKFTIRVPQVLQDALIDLYMEAKRIDIDFVPHEIMLNSLLDSARLLQNKIDKINGFQCGILQKIGIETEKTIKQEKRQELQDEEGQLLFKRLLKLEEPAVKICTELEEVAKQYGHNKRIPPWQLQEWAENIPHRSPNKRIRKWHYAIAIAVLHKHNVNPITIISSAKVAEYWAIQNQNKYTLKEAIEQFIIIFDVPDKEKSNILNSITSVYKNLIAV